MYNDYHNALAKVYEAALWAAPDESTRRAIRKLRDEIAKPDWHGEDVKGCARTMASILYDGLAFGNWPQE
jgi:hypothetical protein